MEAQKLLPQSEDAEKGALCSFLLSPKSVGGMCADRAVGRSHFFNQAHADIYTVLLGLWSEDRPIDFITLTQILRDRSLLNQCGGAAYITDLFTLLPTAANCSHYLEILEEKRILREIITTCHEHASRSHEEQDEMATILSGLQEKIMSIACKSARKPRTMKENVFAVVDALQNQVSADSPNLIRTGLKAIDEDVGPLERGNLLVIGGQGKAGKSQLAGQIVLNMAFDEKPCLYISLEMTEREVTSRWLASMARVNMRTPRVWSEADVDRFDAAQRTIINLPLFIETGKTELSEIIASCQQHALRSGEPLGAIVLDYAQLTSATSRGRDDRKSREIADISRTCKRLASKLNVLFILLTQLNDDGRTKESRDIENDANLMLEVGHNKETGARGVRVVLARAAPMGQKLRLRIIAEHTRVEDDPHMNIEEPEQKPPKNKYGR